MNDALAALAACLLVWDEADPAHTGKQAASATRSLWPDHSAMAVAELLGATVARQDRESIVCGQRVRAEYDAGTQVITVFRCADDALEHLVAHELFHHLEAVLRGGPRARANRELAAEAFADAWEETAAGCRRALADCER